MEMVGEQKIEKRGDTEAFTVSYFLNKNVASLAPQASPSSSLTTLPSQLRAALNSVGGPTRVGASVSADIALRADLDEAARLTATAARVATLVEATLGGGGGGGGDGA